MGLSVELFKLINNTSTNEEDYYWEHVETLYTSMIAPSRKLLTDTFNNSSNEEFVWGSATNTGCDDDFDLSNTENVTKMPLSTLKHIWKNALDEVLELDNNISDETIVCLATGD